MSNFRLKKESEIKKDGICLCVYENKKTSKEIIYRQDGPCPCPEIYPEFDNKNSESISSSFLKVSQIKQYIKSFLIGFSAAVEFEFDKIKEDVTKKGKGFISVFRKDIDNLIIKREKNVDSISITTRGKIDSFYKNKKLRIEFLKAVTKNQIKRSVESATEEVLEATKVQQKQEKRVVRRSRKNPAAKLKRVNRDIQKAIETPVTVAVQESVVQQPQGTTPTRPPVSRPSRTTTVKGQTGPRGKDPRVVPELKFLYSDAMKKLSEARTKEEYEDVAQYAKRLSEELARYDVRPSSTPSEFGGY